MMRTDGIALHVQNPNNPMGIGWHCIRFWRPRADRCPASDTGITFTEIERMDGMNIRRLVLDVDKAVAKPSVTELAEAICQVAGVEAVNITLVCYSTFPHPEVTIGSSV